MEDKEFRSMVAHQRKMLGAYGESVVAAALYRNDHPVFRPLHDSQVGYDLIADINGRLVRIQVKVISTQGQVNLGWDTSRKWGSRYSRPAEPKMQYGPDSFDVLACVDRSDSKVYFYGVSEIDWHHLQFLVEKSESRQKLTL